MLDFQSPQADLHSLQEFAQLTHVKSSAENLPEILKNLSKERGKRRMSASASVYLRSLLLLQEVAGCGALLTKALEKLDLAPTPDSGTVLDIVGQYRAAMDTNLQHDHNLDTHVHDAAVTHVIADDFLTLMKRHDVKQQCLDALLEQPESDLLSKQLENLENVQVQLSSMPMINECMDMLCHYIYRTHQRVQLHFPQILDQCRETVSGVLEQMTIRPFIRMLSVSDMYEHHITQVFRETTETSKHYCSIFREVADGDGPTVGEVRRILVPWAMADLEFRTLERILRAEYIWNVKQYT